MLRRKDSHEALWLSEEGQPSSYRGVNSDIRRVSYLSGLPLSLKRGAHSYRHTGATEYLRNGGKVKTLQEMLGHVHVSTTEKYLDALGPEELIKDHAKASPVAHFLHSSAQRNGGARLRATRKERD